MIVVVWGYVEGSKKLKALVETAACTKVLEMNTVVENVVISYKYLYWIGKQ